MYVIFDFEQKFTVKGCDSNFEVKCSNFKSCYK